MIETKEDAFLRRLLQESGPAPASGAELALLETRIMSALSRQIAEAESVPTELLSLSAAETGRFTWRWAASLFLAVALGAVTGQAFDVTTATAATTSSETSLHSFVTAQLMVEDTNDY